MRTFACHSQWHATFCLYPNWYKFFSHCLLPPLTFYFCGLPHSSTLFLSPLLLFYFHRWKHSSTDPEPEQWGSKPNTKNTLSLHSVLSFHVNEGKTFTEQPVIQNILPSSNSADVILFLIPSPNWFPFIFLLLLLSFRILKIEINWLRQKRSGEKRQNLELV